MRMAGRLQGMERRVREAKHEGVETLERKPLA